MWVYTENDGWTTIDVAREESSDPSKGDAETPTAVPGEQAPEGTTP
jgi:hypothetical protein